MNTKPTPRVRQAFKLLMRKGSKLTIKDAALNAGCSRSAIYRSELYPAYLKHIAQPQTGEK